MEHTVENKNVVVVGFGRSGTAACALALKKGAKNVVVSDSRDAAELGDEKVLEIARSGVKLELGGHQQKTLTDADLIVISPGVPLIPEVRAAEKAGVPVISE